jgi:hypothetical protein
LCNVAEGNHPFLKNQRVMKLYGFILMCCWGLVFSSSLHAQSFGIQNINITKGLINNSVWGITQDKDGYMWIGSSNGIQRFDGKNFKAFSQRDGLADSEALDFFRNPVTGEIYVQLYPGKASVLKDGKIDLVKSKQLEALFSSRSLLNVTVNSARKTLFVYSDLTAYETDFQFRVLRSFKLSRTEGSLILCFYHQDTLCRLMEKTPKGVVLEKQVNNRFQEVSKICDGTGLKAKFNSFQEPQCLLYDNQHRIYSLDFNSLRIHKIASGTTEISGLLIDSDSILWYGKNNGVYWQNLKVPSESGHLLDQHIVGNIFEDRFHQIWFTTITNGVYYISNKHIRNAHESRPGKSDRTIHTFFRNQNLSLFGYTNNSFLVKQSGKEQLIHIGRPDMFNRVINVLEHRKDILVVHEFGVFNATTRKNNYLGGGIKDFKHLKNNVFLSAGFHGLIQWKWEGDSLIHLDTIEKNKVLCFELINDTTVAYYSTKGCFIRNLRNPTKISPVHFPEDKPVSVTRFYKHNEQVFALDPDGNLYKLSGENLVCTYPNILGNHERIRQILVDDKGTLHAITDRAYYAVFQFSKSGHHQKVVLNYKNGFTHSLINHVFIRNDTVYISGNNGVSFFRLDELQNLFPEKVRISQVSSGDAVIENPGQFFTLNKTQTDLKLECHTIDFNFPEPVFFSYRMVRNGKERYAGKTTENSIVLSELKAGDYVLQVTAFNSLNPNQKSEMLEIRFRKEPLFFENIWVQVVLYVASILVVVWILMYLLRRKGEIEKARNQIQQRITRLELMALRSQLDPHFIFNSLNSIKEFIRKNDVFRSQQYLDDFSTLMRTTLDKSKSRNILLSDEIQYLNTYLTLEQLRFNHRFTFRISPGNLPAELIYIPSMMLQPFVENSIRHGQIGSLAHEGLLEVRFEEMDDDFLKCTILDNGTGLGIDKMFQQTGVHAMSIIQDRINLYNDSQSMKIRFEVKNRADGFAGVLVEILLPILYNEND